MDNFGVKDVANLTLLDMVSRKPVIHMNTLKISNLENNADVSYSTGGSGNARLISYDYNRTARFNAQDALMRPKALAILAGKGDVQKGVVQVFKREVLVSVAGSSAGKLKVTLSKTPKAGTVFLFEGSEDTEVTGALTITTTDVEFDSTSSAGALIVASYWYDTDATATTVTIEANKFPGYFAAVGDTLITNERTGQLEGFQIYMPKIKIASAFTITMQAEGEPSVFDFNMDVFKDSASQDMVKLTKY